MTLIDNQSQTLQDALKNTLSSADKIDIAVGFFYFSGFQALAEELRDKKVRILVGLEIDPKAVPELTQRAKEEDIDLTPWQSRERTTSRTALRDNYIQTLVSFTNDSDVFDDEDTAQVFELFMDKIANGSLEIRKTLDPDHAKYYIVHNKAELSQNGDFPGTVFMGSSNMTYKGLRGQGELNDSYREKAKFEEYVRRFEKTWSEAESIAIADVHTKNTFVNEVKGKIWNYQTPKPYHIYVRVLHEIFNQEETDSLLTPGSITNSRFNDLQYQIDAVRTTIDRLNKYGGAILADVVGLGKSIIASAVARNLDSMKTVIIAPPHLVPQWEEYKEEFGIRGSKVFSIGKIDEVHERYNDAPEPLLFIIDEAHRFRNEDTDDYKQLHQVCRSNPGNKILLLTATPFNNDPKDVFALIKLFDTPGQSRIRSIDNLSLRFRELIDRYKRLRRDMTKGLEQREIDNEAVEIANEQRRLIEMVVIRRSRLDLNHITRYREDLERQNISFANIIGPELMEYDLGKLFDLYTETLEQITGEGNEQAFIGARYKPATYIKDREKFVKEFGEDLDENDLKTAQTNLAQFMRRLLVMRFESSKDAFRTTLENMIAANRLIEEWWQKLGKVPIMKKGQLPNPDDFTLDDADDSEDNLNDELTSLKEKQGLLAVDTSIIDEKFIQDVHHDTILLEQIHQSWFKNPTIKDEDPKLDNIAQQLIKLLHSNPKRKIVIFSVYADTVNYLYKELHQRGFKRVMQYTASESSAAKRESVRENFDASIPDSRQADDYDILVATDALSEGYNLHRAGVVINYDIPFNPTRVIQRIGRINRINKKVFDNLYIYNCFPTVVGEAETRVKQISTLKIKLINAVIGSDTRTLTDDEELESFFKDEFDKAERDQEQLSWDTPHREVYDQAKQDQELMEAALNLPHRSRVRREKNDLAKTVVFGKKGDHAIFTVAGHDDIASVTSVEQALPLFAATQDEEGQPVGKDFLNAFRLAKEKLFAKHDLPTVKGRRADAITVLKALGNALPSAHDHCEDVISIIKILDDISDGTLKDVARLNLQDAEQAYNKLQQLVTSHFIRNVHERVRRDQNEQELLLFAEEFKK